MYMLNLAKNLLIVGCNIALLNQLECNGEEMSTVFLPSVD